MVNGTCGSTRIACCRRSFRPSGMVRRHADLDLTDVSRNVALADAGWSSSVARRAHNPEVAGSNPAPATDRVSDTKGPERSGPFVMSGPKHWRDGAPSRQSWPLGSTTGGARRGADTMAETVRERAARLIAQGNPAGLLYGAILAGAVMSATANHVPSTARVLVAAVFVLVVYWLADIYVRAFSEPFHAGRSPLPRRLVAAARHESRVLLGGVPALAMTI